MDFNRIDFNKMKNKSDNFYSKALFIIGWGIIVLGVIGSFVLGNTYTDYYGDFNGALFLVGLISTAMSGFLILGLAELISIQNDNRRLLASLAQEGGKMPTDNSNSSSIAEELPEI